MIIVASDRSFLAPNIKIFKRLTPDSRAPAKQGEGVFREKERDRELNRKIQKSCVNWVCVGMGSLSLSLALSLGLCLFYSLLSRCERGRKAYRSTEGETQPAD